MSIPWVIRGIRIWSNGGMIRQGKTEVLQKKNLSTCHCIYHNSIYTASRLNPDLRGKKSETNCYVTSYEARRQHIKIVAVSELHRVQIQIYRHIESLQDEIRIELIKTYFPAVQTFQHHKFCVVDSQKVSSWQNL